MITFEGKTAIVTGAGRGIGAGIARAFAELGASVALVDVDLESLRQKASSLEGEGFTVRGFSGDIRDGGFVASVVSGVTKEWGAVDILVNNAGIIRDNYIEKIADADWDAVLDVNLKGAFLCCRAVVPHMKGRRTGTIVNIISRAWLGNIGQSNYSASKGGLVSLTRTLALELAEFNIRVNGVAPGLIDTPMTRNLPGKVMDRLRRQQPGGRVGTVEDVAAAVCFLASEKAGYITGQILHVDGGKSCGSLAL